MLEVTSSRTVSLPLRPASRTPATLIQPREQRQPGWTKCGIKQTRPEDGFEGGRVPAFGIGDGQMGGELGVVLASGRTGKNPRREAPHLARRDRLPSIN